MEIEYDINSIIDQMQPKHTSQGEIQDKNIGFVYHNIEVFNQWNSQQINNEVKNKHLNDIIAVISEKKDILKEMNKDQNLIDSLENTYESNDKKIQNLLIKFLSIFLKDSSQQNLLRFSKQEKFQMFLENYFKTAFCQEQNQDNVYLVYYSNILYYLAKCKNYLSFIQKIVQNYLDNFDFLKSKKLLILKVYENQKFLTFILQQTITFDEDNPEKSLQKCYNERFALSLVKFFQLNESKEVNYFFVLQKILPYLQFFKNDARKRQVVQILYIQVIHDMNSKLSQDSGVKGLRGISEFSNQDFEDLYLFDYSGSKNTTEQELFIKYFAQNKNNSDIILENLKKIIEQNMPKVFQKMQTFWQQGIDQNSEIKFFAESQDVGAINNYLSQLKKIYKTNEFADLLHCLGLIQQLISLQTKSSHYKNYMDNVLQNKNLKSTNEDLSINYQEILDQLSQPNQTLKLQIIKKFSDFFKQKLVLDFLSTFHNFIEQFFTNMKIQKQKQFYKYIYKYIQIYGALLDIVYSFTTILSKNDKKQQDQSYQISQGELSFFANSEIRLEHILIANQRFLGRYISPFMHIFAVYPKNLNFLSNYKNYNENDKNKNFEEKVLQIKIKKFYQDFSNMYSNSTKQFSINRETLYIDAKKHFEEQKPKELRTSCISVKFQNEPGIDGGGLRREFFFLLSENIFSKDNGMFSEPNQESLNLYINDFYETYDPSHFYFVGQFLAVSILNKRTIVPRLQEILLKMMLNREIIFNDYKKFDPEQYNSFMHILNNTLTEDYDIYFEIGYRKNGQQYNKELIPNGSNIRVLEHNKREYVYKSIKFQIYDKYQKAIDSLLKGFNDIIPAQYLDIFTDEELGYLISGDSIVYASELIDNITCSSGYNRSSKTIEFLFQYLRSYEKDNKDGQYFLRGFLQFVTGSGQVPYGGLRNLRNSNGEYSKINIAQSSNNTNELPTASTCSNFMRLPAYETYDQLKNKMDAAIKYGNQGFAFG